MGCLYPTLLILGRYVCVVNCLSSKKKCSLIYVCLPFSPLLSLLLLVCWCCPGGERAILASVPFSLSLAVHVGDFTDVSLLFLPFSWFPRFGFVSSASPFICELQCRIVGHGSGIMMHSMLRFPIYVLSHVSALDLGVGARSSHTSASQFLLHKKISNESTLTSALVIGNRLVLSGAY